MYSRPRLHFTFLLLALVSLGAAAAFAQEDPEDFTLVVLPDTQNYSQSYPQIFTAQTQWIVANAASQNIVFVIGEGDIVNVGTSATQWSNADSSIKLLDDASIPYILAIGNHDYDNLPPLDPNRPASNYNQWFGLSRYSVKPYFGGSYPTGGTENMYVTFTWGGKSYLILSLEYVARQGAVDWARSVLDANPDKEIIVVTHSYLYSDGTTVDQCDTDDMRGDYNGAMLWASLLRQYANVSVVLSGHIVNQYHARRDDVNLGGNFVHEIFANWQDDTNGGNGNMRVMQFSPANNTITVQSYSPYTSEYLTDLDDQFTFKWHNDGAPGAGSATVNGIVRSFNYGAACVRLAGATVNVAGMSAVTDSNGRYSLTVPAGTASASASGSGWQTASQSVTLNDYFPNQVDFFLQPSAPCPQSNVDPSVTVCTPADQSAVISPVHVVAGSNSSSPVTSMNLWLDGSKVYGVSGASLDTSVAMSSGEHRLVVQGHNVAGATFNQVEYVTAGTSPPPPPGSCSPSSIVPSVNLCAPANNASVSSPFQVTAAGNMANRIARMELWLDGSKYYQIAGASLATQVTAASGSHRITVQAVDSTGATTKQSVAVTVGSSPPPPSGCTAGTASPSVTICSPANNSTSASPVSIVAATTDNAATVDKIALWVDGVKVWQQSVSSVNTSLAMSAGTHRITVQAHDSAGTYFKSSVSVTVQ